MSPEEFADEIISAIKELEFVDGHSFVIEKSVLKGRIFLSDDKFMQVYVNTLTNSKSFTLIHSDQRIWGIDFDNLIGWHLHPLENPDLHLPIKEKNIVEIVQNLIDIWNIIHPK